MRLTRCCCPAMRTRSPRSCVSAPTTASRSCPFGGGTSVVGGLDPERDGFDAVVSLDLRRLNELHALDEVSGEAELGAGVTGPEAERLLGERGFSLGHFPQSFQFATIGGFAATRSSGQNSAGYGRFNDMVRGLRAVTPAGVLDLGRAPESAAGPDLRQLLIGSEGVFGVITRVRVAGASGAGVHPLRGVVVPGLRYGRRRAARSRADRHRAHGDPAIGRGGDGRQPGHHRQHRRDDHHRWLPGHHRVRGHRRAMRKAGTPRHAPCSRRAAAHRWARARPERGSTVGSPHRTCAIRCWRQARCARPLRPRPRGPIVPALKAAVTEALTSSARGIGHARACAVPYFARVSHRSVVVLHRRRRPARQPIDQWRAAKTAATDAMVRTGATITHHHAVGADHRAWMRDEIGDLGVEVLRAVKATARSLPESSTPAS